MAPDTPQGKDAEKAEGKTGEVGDLETRRKALADKDSEWEDSRGQTPFVDDVVADLTAE